MFFTHAQKPKFGPFLANHFPSFSLALFFFLLYWRFCCPLLSSFFCMELWLANFLGRDKFNFQGVVCKQRQWNFFPKFHLFCECNSVRVSQNIPKWGISLERSIFADVVAYQFININWKLNGSGKNCIHCTIWGRIRP